MLDHADVLGEVSSDLDQFSAKICRKMEEMCYLGMPPTSRAIYAAYLSNLDSIKC